MIICVIGILFGKPTQLNNRAIAQITSVPTSEKQTQSTEVPIITPNTEKQIQPTETPSASPLETSTPNRDEDIMGVFTDNDIRSKDAQILVKVFTDYGFHFEWRTAPNGNRIYQAQDSDGTVITLTGANKETLEGVAIAIPITNNAEINSQNSTWMRILLESFPGWKDGRMWLKKNVEAWSKSLENDAPKGLYTETRGSWKVELLFMSPQLVILTIGNTNGSN